jgi:SAM-dependent methyltransferase
VAGRFDQVEERLSRVRGWLALYGLSWRLGCRYLLRHGYLREAVVRIVIPLDPSRYLELPETLHELAARPGDAVLDLASPKLAGVALAERGVDVTSVDALAAEVATWRRLAGDRPRLRFVEGDGRSMPFEDASFDHAYSISVLEHIPDEGDREALRELARVVKPGGRVVITMPYADRYREDWRGHPVYGEGRSAERGCYFFERSYDEARVRRLIESVPELYLVASGVSRMSPNWHRLYLRAFPWLIALGPFYGILARRRDGPPGDVVRVTLARRGGE